MFWAIERHLDGRRDHALVLGVLACLLRPELVPFLGAVQALAVVGGAAAAPAGRGIRARRAVAWLVPEWIGAGNPLDGAKQATGEPIWSLSLSDRPWLRRARPRPRPRGSAGRAARPRGRRRRRSQRAGSRRSVLAAAAVAEAALYVVMTQAGFSGNPRYVLPALALICVLAGVGTARILAARRRPHRASLGLRSVQPPLRLCWRSSPCAFVERAVGADGAARLRQIGVRMDLHRDLARAVRPAGRSRGGERLGLRHGEPRLSQPPRVGAQGADRAWSRAVGATTGSSSARGGS